MSTYMYYVVNYDNLYYIIPRLLFCCNSLLFYQKLPIKMLCQKAILLLVLVTSWYLARVSDKWQRAPFCFRYNIEGPYWKNSWLVTLQPISCGSQQLFSGRSGAIRLPGYNWISFYMLKPGKGESCKIFLCSARQCWIGKIFGCPYTGRLLASSSGTCRSSTSVKCRWRSPC